MKATLTVEVEYDDNLCDAHKALCAADAVADALYTFDPEIATTISAMGTDMDTRMYDELSGVSGSTVCPTCAAWLADDEDDMRS